MPRPSTGSRIIILVTGDSDFVPAAKLARREGVEFLLDPLWQDIKADLYEHVDGVVSGFPRPTPGSVDPKGPFESPDAGASMRAEESKSEGPP